MKAVIQRVRYAHIKIANSLHATIGNGLLVLLGIAHSDTEADLKWLLQKIVKLRIFSDEDGKMNLDVQQVGGAVMLVSQFTLHAMTHKGNRPSFIKAAPPEHALTLYNAAVAHLETLLPGKMQAGVFGADMKIELENDGPITIIIDSRQDEDI